MGTVDHRAAVATRKIGDIPNFKWYAWECLDGPGGDVMLTGCVSSGVITKGPRKGRPKYDGAPRRVVVTDAEMLEERRRYERETGNCAECGGDGQMFAGWDHIEGTKWRPCAKCAATGKPMTADAVDPVLANSVEPSTRENASSQDVK